jgi:hypothetical protein
MSRAARFFTSSVERPYPLIATTRLPQCRNNLALPAPEAVLSTPCSFLSAYSVPASNAGASPNSNLLRGGGTDDTEVLQGVLNRAADGTPVHLIVNGVAFVRGLDLFGNTPVDPVLDRARASCFR